MMNANQIVCSVFIPGEKINSLTAINKAQDFTKIKAESVLTAINDLYEKGYVDKHNYDDIHKTEMLSLTQKGIDYQEAIEI